ncbi:anthranilate synthase family protein [Streptomyces sp. SCSIO ZS0520]|uniref:anthranilate synthase family protein n=1 Tax=Streptomyces sp. SCSIO ZS0520 TaxID=2892996 RepID=UPI0021D7EDDF|nr:anthranilate synthase family protein [Streptomyces sp. SCSIO ZS0520]
MSAPTTPGGGAQAAELLAALLAEPAPPFAVLHRADAHDGEVLDLLSGPVRSCDSLAELPLPAATPTGTPGHDLLALIPYRQIRERGYACADDGTPLLAMTVRRQATLSVAAFCAQLPDREVTVSAGAFDIPDDAYADTVRKIISTEIGDGEGANFVIRRSFVLDITDFTPHAALIVFRRLLQHESGAYWTFCIHTGERTLIGATPERHVTLRESTAVMNPISGTYRYPASGPTLAGLQQFIADQKETEELYMVLDEELKMMARICPEGGRVTGPYLRQMARLAHTEYFIEGESDSDVRDILRETMFAPTVTGSPLESACRVIRRHEPEGRGYYSGVAALIGHDAGGCTSLDSSILIRTADIDPTGRTRIGTGATLVRHSDPEAEVAETRAKAAGLLAALGTPAAPRLADHPDIRTALSARNQTIASFWLDQADRLNGTDPDLAGLRVLVVDAEDTFTQMLGHQLRSLGLDVRIRRFDEAHSFDGHDLVVMGPGPGDPNDGTRPKIAHLRGAVRTLLDERRPFMAVCLSHQVLCRELGFTVARCPAPHQGLQREINLFGSPERVGYYNTFAALSDDDKADCGERGTVEVCRDESTGEVHALRGPHFTSMQFHAESVLTQDGPRILSSALKGLLKNP